MEEPETIEAVESLVRHTEMSGSEVFEKNFIKGDEIAASVFVFVGPHAEELTAVVREWCNKNDMIRNN